MEKSLFLEKIVEVTSDEDIDALEHGDVVWVKNSKPAVFDRREEDKLFFYLPGLFKGDVTEYGIPRKLVSHGGNMIYLNRYSHEVERRDLTESDGDYFLERKEYMEGLGLLV